jgi:hypothetical protein
MGFPQSLAQRGDCWVWKRETYTAKVFVQELDISVDQLQCDKLVVLALNGTAEVQAGIPEKGAHEAYLEVGFGTQAIWA